MIGRGTRTFPQKRNCLILDFCDNASRNDLCTYKNTLDGAVVSLVASERDDVAEEGLESSEQRISRSIDSNDDPVYQDRIEDIEFFDSSQFAWTPVGDGWHLNLSSSRDVWVRQVNGGFLVVAQSDGDIVQLSNRPLPLDYALGMAEDWSRRQTTKNAWARKDAPWRSQLATQKQMDTLTKLDVSLDYEISKGEASQLLDRRINEPATTKQIYRLKVHGIPVNNNISKLEARKIISGRKTQ
jgi:hypothetical protein